MMRADWLAELRAGRRERAGALRKLVERGETVRGAGEKLGMSKSVSAQIAKDFGIKSGLGKMRDTSTRDAHAEQMRALLDKGLTIPAAAAQIGIGITNARDIAADYGLQAKPGAVIAARIAGLKASAKQPGERTKAGWTEAQYDAADALRKRIWGNPILASMPPVTDEEAERLVAEFLARKAVTVCPPAATPQLPFNAGQYWR